MKINQNIAVFGAQFGDEAKARVIHYFSKNFEFTARFHSGGNAGHTIYHNGKKIVRHLIPSTDFSQPRNQAFLGAGMVVHLDDLFKEASDTEKMFPGSASRIIIDPDAFVVDDDHIEEDKEKNAHIGSTNKGITPAYKDKIGRTGTKVSSFIKDNAEVIKALKDLGVRFQYSLELKPLIERSTVIFEGSQSILLDLNFGNYPFVTSGECGLGGIYNAGFAFAPPTKVYGCAKAYMTKAGGGISKFITELPDKEASIIREKGAEIGATTSRPRRIGALDLPALKYSIIKGGITHLILTKLDVLNGMDKIKVCYDYGKEMFSGNDYENATPFYTELPGWQNARDIDQIRPFLSMIENYINIPIEYVSVGVNDEDMIKIQPKVENQETKGDRFTDPFDTSQMDLACKRVGFPTLSEVISDKIKQRIIK